MINLFHCFFVKVGIPIILLSIGISCTLEREPIRPKTNLDKNEPIYYDFIARKFYNDEEFDKAIFQYQKIIDKFSGQPTRYGKELAWAKYEIGFCYYRLGDMENAIKYFQMVLDQHPTQSSTRILAEDRIQNIPKNSDN